MPSSLYSHHQSSAVRHSQCENARLVCSSLYLPALQFKHHLCTHRIWKGHVKGFPKPRFSWNWVRRPRCLPPKYIDVLKSPFCRSSPLCIRKVVRTPRPPLLGSCPVGTRSLGSQETEAAADLYINAWAWGFNDVNKRFEHVALRRCCGSRAAPIPSKRSMACFSRHPLVGTSNAEKHLIQCCQTVSPANSTITKLTWQ